MKPKSVDLSEFAESTKRYPCKVRSILAELDDERREKLEAALAAGKDSISHMTIATVVTGWGYPLSDNRVGVHRNKACSCD